MISLQLEKYLIEFIGTFFFLYVIISTGFHPIIIGGALALVIFSGGEISGGSLLSDSGCPNSDTSLAR